MCPVWAWDWQSARVSWKLITDASGWTSGRAAAVRFILPFQCTTARSSPAVADAVVLNLEADTLARAERGMRELIDNVPSAVISSRLVRIETFPARSLGMPPAAFLTKSMMICLIGLGSAQTGGRSDCSSVFTQPNQEPRP